MPHISNPRSSHGQSAIDTNTGAVVVEYEAGAAIAAGQCVAATYTPATGRITVAPTAATTDNVVGVAKSAAAVGETVMVVTFGPVKARVTASITSGGTATTRLVSAGASGRIVAGVTTAGHVRIGSILEDATGKANDELVGVFVKLSS